MSKQPIIIVGMARSGTTLVSHIFGSISGTHLEVEPHALWKSGNFNYLNDEEFTISESIISNIRNRFLSKLPDDKVLVEKSPINCLRPDLVHSVFPDAKLIYVERDPVRCIYSNYKRSLKNDSFKFSIILKKYFHYTGSRDLEGAISNRSLFNQIRFSDLPFFLYNTTKMLYIRNVLKILPFGPKLTNFTEIIREKGLLGYHVEVYKKSLFFKLRYQNLFGDNMACFKMENLMTEPSEIHRLFKFAGLESSSIDTDYIMSTFDPNKVQLVNEKNDIDEEIMGLLG